MVVPWRKRLPVKWSYETSTTDREAFNVVGLVLKIESEPDEIASSEYRDLTETR
jgi:hypothetical protein